MNLTLIGRFVAALQKYVSSRRKGIVGIIEIADIVGRIVDTLATRVIGAVKVGGDNSEDDRFVDLFSISFKF